MVSIQSIKDNVSAIGTIIAFFTTIIGGAIAVESRYAKAEDIKSVREFQFRSHEQLRFEQRQNIDSLRKQTIEDKLFELRLKQNPSPVDKALIQRYEDQLKEIAGRINQPAPPPAVR